MIPVLAAAIAAEVPTPADEEAWLVALEASLDDGHAMLVATGLAHHAWSPPKSCEDAAGSVAWRSRAFLDAWRAVVEQALGVATRIERFRDAETVAPLRSSARSARIDGALERARRLEAAWRGSAEWHRKQVTPYLKRCPSPPAAAPGWVQGGVRASDDPSDARAVWALGDGWLCAAGATLAIEEGPVLTEAHEVCLAATSACDCSPAPVLAGAAIAPQTR